MPGPASDIPAVEASGVVKVFGDGGAQVRALDGVDLRVARGEMVAIIGPSGTGKSTLLHNIVAFAAIVLGTLAAIVPARRAARLNVIEALSYE